jgi:hypothetical protein
MHGIPENFALDGIVDSEIQQICSGRFDLQFRLSSGLLFSVQGDISLLEGDQEVGKWTEQNGWTSLAFQQLINTRIKEYRVPNNRLLQIVFENGLTLQLHHSSDQYESFQIVVGGDKLWIVV